MSKRRQALMLVSILLMTLLLAAILTFVSSRKVAVEIYVAAQQTVVRQTAEKFRFAIELGKPIDRFYGSKDLLTGMVTSIPNIKAAWIQTETGEAMYAYPEYSEGRDEFYFEIPIGDESAMAVQLYNDEVQELLLQYKKRIQIYVLSIFAVGAVLIVCINNTKVGKRASIAVLLLAQLSFGILVAASYRETYMQSINGTALAIDRIILNDINKLENFGIPGDEFVDFDVYLEEIAISVGVFEKIETLSDISAENTNDYLKLNESGLYALLNEKAIYGKILGYMLDALILSAVTLFLALEGLRFLEKPKREPGVNTFSLPTFRFAIFVVYFGINMSAAFTAVLAKRLAISDGYVSDFIVGLPISAEMLAGLCAICVSRTIIRKLGFTRSMYCGVIAASCGLIFSALANNVAVYAIARIFVGLGFSFITISARVIASSREDAQARSSTLTGLISSSIIGYCSGTVIGGLLAERMSFGAVFCIAAVITLLSMPLIRLCGANSVLLRSSHRLRDAKVFIDRRVVVYLLAIVMPCNAAGMFMTYSVPLLGDSFGLTTSLVSALIMVNSLIVAYASTVTCPLILKLMGSEKSVLFYAFLITAVLLCFTAIPVLWVLIAATVLLGIADSFGLVMMSHDFTEIPAVSKAGAMDAMLAVTLSGRAGQFAAPQLFAITPGSPLLVGVMTAAGAIAYKVVGRSKAKCVGEK